MITFMRFLVLLLFAAPLPLAATPAAASDSGVSKERDMITVGSVDLVRYTGLWYEIAKIPNRFQRQCARGTTAEYTLRTDGRISVLNRCIKEDGSFDEAGGVAKVVDEVSNAKLKVSFVSFLGWRPFWGDYWVIGLDEGYQWAVIGTPGHKYGWVLARTQTLPEETMEEVFAILESNGYSRNDFEMSPQ